MLSANEIREVKFPKSMSGYKQEDVDIFLDKVESDYEYFEKIIKELGAKVESLNQELQEHKSSQDSIQNVLVSAQKLADNIVSEAKAKSEQIVADAQKSIENITNKEKELSEMFDKKAEARKAQIEQEMTKIVAEAQAKKESIEKATADSVARQKMLFDRLKIEIAAFRAEVNEKYKQHIELLAGIVPSVPMSPEEIAVAVSAELDKAPEAKEFLPEPQIINEQPVIKEEEPEKEGIVINEPKQESDSAKQQSIFGFVVRTEDDEEEETLEDQE